MNQKYKINQGWVCLQSELLEVLPEKAIIDMHYKEGVGHSAVVRKQLGAPDCKALYIFSGPRVAEDWDTLVLADIESTIGRYTDLKEAVVAANKWARRRKR
jgi:hypothetical protein